MTQPKQTRKETAQSQLDALDTGNPLDTPFFDGHERKPVQPHAPPERAFTRWLSLEEIRKMQRMRRSTVIQAMKSGELPFEQRGRIRYARLSDILAWEERRIAKVSAVSTRAIDSDLADLIG